MDDFGVVWTFFIYGESTKGVIESATEREAQRNAEQWLDDEKTLIYFFAELEVA